MVDGPDAITGYCQFTASSTGGPYVVDVAFCIADIQPVPGTVDAIATNCVTDRMYVGASVTSASSGGTATTSQGPLSATATGGNAGNTLVVADYTSNPTVANLSVGNDQYFDVRTSPGSAFTNVVIRDCNDVTPSTGLSWWDDDANAGNGGWEPVVGANPPDPNPPGYTYSAGPPACVSATLDTSTSTPTISQLTGTIFGASNLQPGVLINSGGLPNAEPGTTYGPFVLAATGGNAPYKWKVSSGVLPKGLHLKSGGVISGKPKKTDSSGTYSFTVKVVDKKTKTKPHTQNVTTERLSITVS